MNGINSTTASCRRVNRAAMPQLPIRIDQPICSEALDCLDDVLLSGSDDEYYDDSDARRRRIEEHAQMFLDGKRPFLLSASLRGPFGKESGWQNPWRGKGGRSHKAAVGTEKEKEMETEKKKMMAEEPRQTQAFLQTDETPPTSPVLPLLPSVHQNLGSIPGISALGEKNSQPKKRSASTDWLRRKNLKRMRPMHDSDSTASPTATRASRPVVVARAFRTPVLARSFSAPVEPRFDVVTAAADRPEESVPSEESAVTVSHISDSERCMSVPSDMLWTSHSEMQQSTSRVEIDETIMLDLLSSIDAGAAEDANAMEEDAEADLASQQIVTEEAQFESQRSSSPVPAPIDATKDNSTAKPHKEAPELSEDERLATQFQSHWSKPQAPTIIDANIAEFGTEDEDGDDDEDEDEDEHDEDTATVNADAEVQDHTITKPPLPAVSTTTQSTFSRESQWQLPAPSSPPALPTTPVGHISATQNPWVEESDPTRAISSSQPNLPTSPCSPGQDVSLPQFSSERHQHQEPFLPSLPIPIPITHSSGTAPSTPDTKQSSLPTPDMTMSIKSFRRFRSPTPTPPPRRKNKKKGGPRSILKQTRRKSGNAPSASSSGRRIQFSLPDDDDNEDGADEGGVTFTEGVIVEEEDFIKTGLSGTSRGRKFTCDLQAKSSNARLRSSQRATSPPPQDKTLMETLPSEVEKFQGHFASVVGRANGTSVSASTTAASRANAASSVICRLKKAEVDVLNADTSSPAIEAMASRSQEADAQTSRLQQTSQQSLPAAQRPRESSMAETGSKLFGTMSAFGIDKENAWTTKNDQAGDDDAESVVDDVQEVMDNLDDFLGMWDMDAELAQVRSGRV